MTGETAATRPAHWVNEHRKQVIVALVMLQETLPTVISDLSGNQLTTERAEHVADYLDRLAAQLRGAVPTVIHNPADGAATDDTS